MKEPTNIRKQEIYGNWKVYSVKGDLLFLCLEERANWYLSRNLASQTSIDPPEIQLNFETKKEGNKDDAYYLGLKKNQCVKCGTEVLTDLTKHHIVPRMYRQHFPEEIKSRNSFDVLPMCFEHHEEYERHADLLKLKLADQYSAPLGGIVLEGSKEQKKALGSAKALLAQGAMIPDKRKKELLKAVRPYIKKDNISNEDLQVLVDEFPKLEVKMMSHAEIVMQQITDNQAFVEMWRYHFLEHVKPAFMPENWDPKRSIVRQ